VIDDFTREALAVVVDTSLSGMHVVRELDQIIARRGKPAMIVSDNGTELTGHAILMWSHETGVEWDAMTVAERGGAARQILRSVRVHPERIDLSVDHAISLGWILDEPARRCDVADDVEDALVLRIKMRLARTGKGMRLVLRDAKLAPPPDASLVRILMRARRIGSRLRKDPSLTFRDIAAKEGCGPSYATRLYRLNFIAPDIVAAIIDGTQPAELTTRRLMNDTRLPLIWTEQRRVLCVA